MMKMMLVILRITLLASSGIATNAAAITTANTNDANNDDVDVANVFPKTEPRRVLITKYEDIADRIRDNMGNQATRHFDIEAEAEADDDFTTGAGSTLLLHLDKMTPAVTPNTVFKFHPSRQFNQEFVNDLAILASSPGKGREFTMMSVDTQTGDVRGLQRGRKGDTRQISIGSEGSVQGPTLRARTMAHSARNFTCGVDHTDHHHYHHDHERKIPSFIDYHKHESTKLFSPKDVRSQSSDKGLFRTTATDATSRNADHGFIINLVIAVDADLIKRQGGTREAVEYVNFLVSAANVIYEEELNAHLNVVRIEETEIFKNVNSLRTGLKTMRQHYEGTFGGDGTNLIHAMLGKHIGGGIAFIDTVCDSKWGVGLSSGLRGSMNSLDDDALQDMFMVAHEIGHSLGSGHTFDDYDPPVDTCDGNVCPAGLPLENSATIMSYCKFCDGGLNNIALTFGGVWNGVGSRFDVNAWDTNSALIGESVSTDPKRVSHRIWTRLTSKGECIRPARADSSLLSLIATPTPTVTPTDFPTTPTQTFWVKPEKHCMQEMNCAAASGIMFDLSLLEEPFSYGVLVESIQFEHKYLNMTVDLYTTDEGSYVGREQLSDQWRKIATVSVNERQSYTEIALDTPITIPPGNKQGFYLVTPNVDLFLVGIGSSPSSTDANGVSLQGGSVIFDMFGINVTGYYPTVQAGYTMALPPTMQPTTSSPTLSPVTPSTMQPTTASPTLSPITQPTMQPTTSSPTLSPTMDHGPFSIGPDYLCDNDCFAAPGFMFNVKNRNNATREIIITGVSFEHMAPKQYRIVDLYSGREQEDIGQWQKIASMKVPKRNFYMKEFVFDTPILLSTGESVGFYLKTEENILLVGKNNNRKNDWNDETSIDDGKVQLVYGSAFMNTNLGDGLEGYSWNGAVTYSTFSNTIQDKTRHLFQ